MDEYVFDDAIAGSTVSCTFPGLEAVQANRLDGETSCTSLFFPGCSFINYAMPLVQSVYDLLLNAGEVNGISLLCCGKILEYEDTTGNVRTDFEQQFRNHIRETDVKRIVAACPNCVAALRKLLAQEEETAGIEVVPLPAVLVQMGYQIDAETAASMVRADPRIEDDAAVVFCPKDSCPDRATGEFADALRAIMPSEIMVEPKYARKRSYCCGSRPRAAGHYDLGDKMARRHGEHAQEVGANAIVTNCFSCAFSLMGAGCSVPVFHYLELLFNWNIPWYYADGYMKLRFLFNDSDTNRDVRGFKGIG